MVRDERRHWAPCPALASRPSFLGSPDDQIDPLAVRDRHDLGRGIAGAYVGRGGKPFLPSE
jgi:hypothetical protein